MMSEHLSQIQLAGYGGRSLDADELLAVDRHLASCDVCYKRFTLISPSTSDLYKSQHYAPASQSKEEPFHLDYYDHLAPYVEGIINDIDREIVESHVALCSECADDLSDLQEFRNQPVPTVAHSGRTVRPSPWKRWIVLWLRPIQWNPQLTAALAILVFILGLTVAVLLWTRYRMTSPMQQAGHTPSEADKQIPGANKDSISPSGSGETTAEKVAAQPSPQQGDRTDQPKSQEPFVALNDGMGQVTLDQSGHVAGLQSVPPDLRKSIESVLVTRELPVTQTLDELSPGSSRLRGGSSEQNFLMPSEPTGIVIESDRPTFRWRAIAGGSDYVVTIYDSQLRSVQNSGPLAVTEWTPPTSLQRGVTYSWQISAVKEGRTVVGPKPPAPEARFKVLDRNEVTALQNAKRLHGRSHLVMGVYYWRLGLIHEAEREFEALVITNPESPIAVDLLRSLRALRR